MDVKDIIRNKVEALRRTVGNRRVGVYGGDFGRFNRNMKSILEGIDVTGIYIPAEVLAATRYIQQQLAVAEAKLSQLKVLDEKLKRWKERSVNQKTDVSTAKVGQLRQNIKNAIAEAESIKTELSNGIKTSGENICDEGYRVFTNLDEFLGNTDICLCWGKGGNYAALLNRMKILFPQNRLIDLLDPKDANSLTTFIEGRYDYFKLFRLTSREEEVLAGKSYNIKYLKKTSMNIFREHGLRQRSDTGFTAVDSFEQEKEFLAKSGFDSEVLDFELEFPYFLQSMLKTGFVFSLCPVCGKVCKSNQSFYPYQHLFFYRFRCCRTFYLIIGSYIQRKIGMYIPRDEVMINFIYYKNGGASEEPYNRPHYVERINEFKKHIIFSWDDVEPYITSPDKKPACLTAFGSNIGHYLSNEVAAIQKVYDTGDISNIHTFIIGNNDYFNIPQLFPQLPILNRDINHSTISIDVFKMVLKNNLFCFRLFFGGPLQEKLAQRLYQKARKRCLPQFLQVVDDSGKHYPLIWVTLRTHNRAWLSQKEGLANVLNKLYEDFPNLGVIFDGMPREAQLMNEIKALLNPRIAVFNALNCSKEQTIVWVHQIDFFIAPHAAGTIFTTIANKTGVVHTHSMWARNAPYILNKRENGVPAYPIPAIGDEDNDDHFTCNYHVHWKDVYNAVVEVISTLKTPQVPAVLSKRTKVLLLSPLFDRIDELPPMGIAYLAGYFKDHPAIELSVPYHPQYKGSIEDCVSDTTCDIVSTGGMLTYMDFFKEFFNTALEKNPGAKRVIGGPVVSAFDKEILFDALPVDVAVYGEGEESFEELILALKENRALDSVKGIIYRTADGRIVKNPPRPPINLKEKDLRPDWSFFDMEGYFDVNVGKIAEGMPILRSVPVLSGRGCPNKCHFCHSPLGRYRKRPTEMIISEIKDLNQKYNTQGFGFRDETSAAPKRMAEICDALIDAKLNLKWACGLRTNLLTENSLKKMKEAGCVTIQLGLESGSEKTLKRMNKNVRVEDHKKAVILARKVGIRPMIAIMFGYIDETIEDLKKTVDLLIELNELPEYLSLTTPIPGTKLFDECVERGLITDVLGYIKKMNQGLYLTQKPLLNLTKIPDHIYYKVLLSEKRRLYTAHFLKNKAIISNASLSPGSNCISFTMTCPHCGISCSATVQPGDLWWHKHLCLSCMRYIWIDSTQIISQYQQHFMTVSSFLDKVERDNKALVMFSYADGENLPHLFEVDPWSRIWDKVTGVIGRDYHYFDRITPQQAANSAVLITNADPNGVFRNFLIQQGFSLEEFMTAFPLLKPGELDIAIDNKCLQMV